MQKSIIILGFIIISTALLWAQNGASFVNSSGDTLMQVRDDGRVIIGAAVVNGNAVLDVDAVNNDKGILIPRLSSAQRTAISGLGASDEGLLVYDETSGSFWFWSGSQWNELGSAGGGNSWGLTGNAGTVDGTNFLGTTDEVALELRVNNKRVLRIEPAGGSSIKPNIIGGSPSNSVSAGVVGATIGGGGDSSFPNQVTAGGGTVSGGRRNTASGLFATVPGGQQNTAGGSFSFAAGLQANALHDGTFVWADNTATFFASTAINQFLIRAAGGVGINKNNPATALDVNGTVTATAFVGDGSGLTGISGDNLGNHTATQTLNLANNNVSNGGTVTANAFVGDGSGLTNFPGDNLGNHTATQMLNLANNNVSNGGTVTANAFVGDGSGLTNLPGDNLGNHTATQALNLSGNNLINGGTVTASAFAGDGSGLTGISGDNLGNHTATQTLNLNGNHLSGDGDSEGVFVATDGKVGIGTNTPASKLEVGGSGKNTITISGALSASPDAFATLDFRNLDGNASNTNYIGARIQSWNAGTSDDGDLRFFTTSDLSLTERMRITHLGNIGIGTVAPTTKLDVNGTVTATAFVGDGSGLTGADNQTLSLSGTQLSITDGNSVNLAGLKDNLGNHTATQSLDMNGKWLTNDANFNNGIFLQTNGHVGIGTADPQAKLDIRPGNDGDPNSDPTSMTGLNVDISTFGGAGNKFAALFLGGNVGIGTSNPTQAKVVINGSVLNTLSYGWLNSSGQTGGSGSPSTNPYSLYANERIAASEFNAHSDMRIKNIKGTSDAADDLNTLMQIEITDYTFRDTHAKGNAPQKKVIAQQVAKVYPQAVTSNLTEVVPDIYQRAEVKDGWIMLATDLKAGERVKIITEQCAELFEVTQVEESRFQAAELQTLNVEQQTVFVYGREVNDFHTVDYEAIAMLNVSATQELYRLIQQQQREIDALKSQNNALKKEVASLSDLQAKVAQIELALRRMNNIELTSAESK